MNKHGIQIIIIAVFKWNTSGIFLQINIPSTREFSCWGFAFYLFLIFEMNIFAHIIKILVKFSTFYFAQQQKCFHFDKKCCELNHAVVNYHWESFILFLQFYCEGNIKKIKNMFKIYKKKMGKITKLNFCK